MLYSVFEIFQVDEFQCLQIDLNVNLRLRIILKGLVGGAMAAFCKLEG